MVLLLTGVAAIIGPLGSRRNTSREASRDPAHALHHLQDRPFP
jgi:hypothetical protein